jgi:phosphatidate cytidylyltransferase
MIKFFYIAVIALFIVGGVLIHITNRKKNHEARKGSWAKYISYFVIVNMVVLSIILHSMYFFYVSLGIIAVCLFEIIRTIFHSHNLTAGLPTLLVFLILSFLFIRFSLLDQGILLYTYLIVSVFDAFSQLTGQLKGRLKLAPVISPNKTWEGFFGGLISAAIISGIFHGLLETSILKALVIGFSLSVAALSGDLLASLSKRKFGIKDFSNLLPGQGGFLDRFDSFIFAGAMVMIFEKLKFL